MTDSMLKVENLRTYYHTRSKVVPAVDGISFTLGKGEMLGIVGESGCGKSTVARTIMGLLDPHYTKIESGCISYKGQDLLKLGTRSLNKIRGKEISMIFQNPLSSLNPVYTVENQIKEVLRIHKYSSSNRKTYERCLELMKLVGIPAPEERMKDFPHQLSGGMQQRIIIAIALACNPNIIIADEPTTALDVTIQAQILELIKNINQKLNMGMILISHNMGIVAEMCDRIIVMYGGVTVEEGNVLEVFKDPKHPYTKGLLEAIPSIEITKEELYTIKGTVPRFAHPIKFCRFSDRCEYVSEECLKKEPELIELDAGRKVRCVLFTKGA